ncbi:hypothetical protein [Nakamurella endophytica]|uniref:ABC transporter permease n=1 Tax=Nakamurella endophytica TaxID=1748367 RepID=A0A917ST34_9ACTN|nr:hypothetical protein [Nakamurella endophytica]GGL96326.1 ABC transporter permease [Nakamurella endophytica]
MSLLTVERIKLFSTRSPYWCLAAVLAASLLFALLFGLVEAGRNAEPRLVLSGVGLGQDIFMVMAALAVTTEYRFGTLKTTFLAAPRRTSVLTAKTVLLAVIGAVVGVICPFAAFFFSKALASDPPSSLVLQGEVWREVTGFAALFAVSAVIAVAVGTLLRQSAGAVSILLIWPLLIEQLIGIIPTVGPKIQPWLPFQAGAAFVSPTRASSIGDVLSSNGPTPVQGLLAFIGYAVVLWAVAAVVLRRRDA